MGKLKYCDVRDWFKRSPVISTTTIKKRAGKYTYLLLKNLVKQGIVKKLTKSCYSLEDDPSLAVFCFKPAYLGLQDALSIRNLWEQETIPVIITTKKVRQGVRKVMESNVLVRRISPKYFFGFDMLRVGKFYFPVSDVEKTLIDFYYFNQKLDKLLVRKIKREIDEKKLLAYLKKYSGVFQKKFLKFLQNPY